MSTEITLPSFYSALDHLIVAKEIKIDTGVTLSGYGSARALRRPRMKITYRVPDNLKIDKELLDRQKAKGDIYGYYLYESFNGTREIDVIFEM